MIRSYIVTDQKHVNINNIYSKEAIMMPGPRQFNSIVTWVGTSGLKAWTSNNDYKSEI